MKKTVLNIYSNYSDLANILNYTHNKTLNSLFCALALMMKKKKGTGFESMQSIP